MELLPGKSFIFHVTRDDIENGDVSYNKCPIALAGNKAMKLQKGDWLSVTGTITFQITRPDGKYNYLRFSADKSLLSWISAFDKGDTVEPIDVELMIRSVYPPNDNYIEFFGDASIAIEA